MPKPFPAEFRRDVIAVARNSDASRAQIARDFGISESCLNRWLKIADREDGLASPGSAGAGSASGSGSSEAELRELRRRNRELEQENEVLRRATAYFARGVLPK
jgi:transposase